MIGILALQGDFEEHAAAAAKLGKEFTLVKKADDLDKISHLIIPGGESTTFSIVAEADDLIGTLQDFAKSGKPIWGTCAGVIFLARDIEGAKKNGQRSLKILDITASRNYFGRQTESFETSLKIKNFSDHLINVAFIRAPAITRLGKSVEVLAEYEWSGKSMPVAVKQDNILATTFHSELTNDTSLLEYFLSFK